MGEAGYRPPRVEYLREGDVRAKPEIRDIVGDFIVGGVVALALIALALGLGRALLRPAARDAAATGNLVGSLATVVTTIPDDGAGEVTISHTDQLLRMNASADGAIAAGATVVVLDVASPTEVLVAQSGF